MAFRFKLGKCVCILRSQLGGKVPDQVATLGPHRDSVAVVGVSRVRDNRCSHLGQLHALLQQRFPELRSERPKSIRVVALADYVEARDAGRGPRFDRIAGRLGSVVLPALSTLLAPAGGGEPSTRGGCVPRLRSVRTPT